MTIRGHGTDADGQNVKRHGRAISEMQDLIVRIEPRDSANNQPRIDRRAQSHEVNFHVVGRDLASQRGGQHAGICGDASIRNTSQIDVGDRVHAPLPHDVRIGVPDAQQNKMATGETFFDLQGFAFRFSNTVADLLAWRETFFDANGQCIQLR